MRYIAREWADYRERIMTPDAGIVQVRETRMAFYAGIEALMRVMFEQLDAGTSATDTDLAVMENIDAELRQFAKDAGEEKV